MGRPRKSAPEQMATARIESAFWDLLEEVPYSEITVMMVTQKSGVNRNSFYYHYEGINDLARQAFLHNADNEVSKTLISALVTSLGGEDTEHLVFDPSILPHTKRIMLCAASDSPFLTKLTRDLLKEVWFDSLHVIEEALSFSERIQVNFIFAGLVATLGSPDIRAFPSSLTALASSDLGRAMVSTLRGIGARASDGRL